MENDNSQMENGKSKDSKKFASLLSSDKSDEGKVMSFEVPKLATHNFPC
jgi:hypothetical protein